MRTIIRDGYTQGTKSVGVEVAVPGGAGAAYFMWFEVQDGIKFVWDLNYNHGRGAWTVVLDPATETPR